MRFTSAVVGFAVLLALPVVQSQNGWDVTCAPSNICALKGSTVNINCTYKHLLTTNPDTTVQRKFWFTKESNGVHLDLKSDPAYSGRVEYHCENNSCRLTIRNLTDSDSAQYKFRFITNSDNGRYTGLPGVTLSVTDLEVKISQSTISSTSGSAELSCTSSCVLPGHLSYIWYKETQQPKAQIPNQTRKSLRLTNFNRVDKYSCAVKGHEDFPSPPVYDHWGVTYTSSQICAFKGSMVEIHCTYRYPSRLNDQETIVQKVMWYTGKIGSDFLNLTEDPNYSGRVFYHYDKNNCTVGITDLEESDSAVYNFRFITNQPGGEYSGLPGVSLSVTDPQLQVHVKKSPVHQESLWVELTCHSSCRLQGPSYSWYRNGEIVEKEDKEYFFLYTFNPADSYSCGVKGREDLQRSPSVYAPKFSLISVSPSGEIEEGRSLTLTCSSDANPAASYTWYKENQGVVLGHDKIYHFTPIRSEDRGRYHCKSENQLGHINSTSLSVDVRYAPKVPSLSLSPSAEIVEGRSVTLTCSSDANPAAKYTWYKENKQLLHRQNSYHFTSISSEDGGIYHCKAENQYGHIYSTSLSVDVRYAPKVPSLSLSPSAEIMEGSSVTLTCSSDANPTAKYTWYKENEDSPIASGQNFTITSVRPEHSGYYYCEAQNMWGHHKNSFYLTDRAGKSGRIANITRLTVLVVITVLLTVIGLRLRKKKTELNKSVETREN